MQILRARYFFWTTSLRCAHSDGCSIFEIMFLCSIGSKGNENFSGTDLNYSGGLQTSYACAFSFKEHFYGKRKLQLTTYYFW